MKNEQSHISEDLLVKYLLGEATAAEQEAVSIWIEQSEANRAQYEQLKRVWESSKKLAAASKVDTDAAWERFKQRVEKGQDKKEQPATKTIPLGGRQMTWLRVAAVLVVLLGGVWMANYLLGSGRMVTLQANNAVITETLPDGSVVTLNKYAVLQYRKGLRGDTRAVQLEGEAFFDVTPNKNKPFIISTGNATVTVVGTSFNVKSSDKRTEVIVETGIVNVAKASNSVNVQPKEKATVLHNNDMPVKEKIDDALYNYYRTKELVCNNTPLWRLVDVLNDAYGVNIVIANDAIKNLPLNTTFKNEPLDNILVVISETLHVQVERNGKDIVIK